MGKQILTKIKDELQKMKQSTDVTYTQTYIPWNKGRGFSVECVRCDEDDNLYDEDGEIVHSMNGVAVEFEVYYQEDEKDVDCCTFDAFLGKDEMKSLEEFVRMYR